MNSQLKKLLAAVAILFILAPLMASAQDATSRPAGWARKMAVAGVANFYQVTTNLYRGAQPTAKGMKQLKAMGIKTVISLREFHSDKDLGDDMRSRWRGAGIENKKMEEGTGPSSIF
jgi:hypothetical protein